MRRPTIIDVVRHAGVSWKTVARVVNRESGVRSDTIVRVDAWIAALAYRPNTAARALAADRTYLIGVLSAALSAHYSVAFSYGAAELCLQRGHHLVLGRIDMDDPDVVGQMDRMLRTADLHGVIVPPPLCNNSALLDTLARWEMPAVLIDPIDQKCGLPLVQIDDEVGVEELVAYAVRLGHRTFAIVEGPPDHRASTTRSAAFHTAVARHGCSISRREHGAFTFYSGFAAGQRLLADGANASFVFATNDDMAAGVIAAAGQARVRVPEDLSVAGFDDSDVAQLTWPPLPPFVSRLRKSRRQRLTCSHEPIQRSP
ncbi:transcriptional regulator, LacI family [Sphingomonas carotinifaciens]|nr:transcriptional regulator, LacI family [Sphingomonas carotinifaciens]